MARKTKTYVPLFNVRHDFADSLQNVCQEAILLLQAIDTTLGVDGAITNSAARDILTERATAFRAALCGDD